jgi:hypothetical protein
LENALGAGIGEIPIGLELLIGWLTFVARHGINMGKKNHNFLERHYEYPKSF